VLRWCQKSFRGWTPPCVWGR